MKQFTLNHSVLALIAPVIGKLCWRKEVGLCKSLSLGFGDKILRDYPKLKYKDKYHGEWEIGTFRSVWRVVKSGKILCASNDPVESVQELDRTFGQIELGKLVSVQQTTDLDVCVIFDIGVTIDFLTVFSDGDESFHIFCPHNKYIDFTVGEGWTIGASNIPWPKKTRRR